VFAARCRIQLFLILSFVCHVLYLCKGLWVLDWCAMVFLLVVCASAQHQEENHRTPIQEPQTLAQIEHVTNKRQNQE